MSSRRHPRLEMKRQTELFARVKAYARHLLAVTKSGIVDIYSSHSSDTGIRRKSSVNRKNYAVDKRRSVIVTKEKKSAGKLGYLAESSHRSCGDYLVSTRSGSSVFIKQKRPVLIRGKESGSDGIYTDIRFGKMYRKPHSEI